MTDGDATCGQTAGWSRQSAGPRAFAHPSGTVRPTLRGSMWRELE